MLRTKKFVSLLVKKNNKNLIKKWYSSAPHVDAHDTHGKKDSHEKHDSHDHHDHHEHHKDPFHEREEHDADGNPYTDNYGRLWGVPV
jgi:hypothetical protein